MDNRVEIAVAHWAARFTTNGVTVSDFHDITSSIEHWADWCAAWCAAGETHEQLGREALDLRQYRSAGEHYSRAAVYYHFAKFLFVDDIDEMRTAHARAVGALSTALPHLDPPGRRLEIPYDGGILVGILRAPAGPGPHPTVMLIPGLDSAKEEFGSTEKSFLDRGLATFSLDGPGQGESEFDFAIRPDYEVPGAAVIDALTSVPEVDSERIGVWGVSLGGYYAPRVASGDHRVKACISLTGPFNWGTSWDSLNELTRAAFRVRSRSTSDDEARAKAFELSLEGRASAINCPLLVIAGKKDRLIPWQESAKIAEEAGARAELLVLDNGNHGCANIAPQHRQRAADWMAARLASRGS